MCRFVVYKGPQILLSEIITKPDHSLIKQSYCAKERQEPLNGDGFGIGWYVPQISSEPCLFTSITPAWANQNLQRIVDKVLSPCIVAHLRAATKGLSVSEQNCHPFQYGPLLWMHNGEIAQFEKVKRKIREALSDPFYNFIQGTTDSEHAFAIFLTFLEVHPENATSQNLAHAMKKTIHFLTTCTKRAGILETSLYNFVVTNGRAVIATRFASNAKTNPESLYYIIGHDVETRDGVCEIHSSPSAHPAIVIASEPITPKKEGWVAIPSNHMLILSEEMHVTLDIVD